MLETMFGVFHILRRQLAGREVFAKSLRLSTRSLWPVLDIFVQKVLGCKYQLQMSLNDLLDIKRPQKVIKRPKKAMKVVKAKSKARGTMV